MSDDKSINNGDHQKKLPHDQLFKRIMENKIAAREFLDEYLPKKVKDIVNLDTIKVEKESYIEPDLTKRFSDIVYRIDTKDNNNAFIYILAEHQSSVDQLMSFRLWRYTLLLAERHINKKAGKIPLILPIVVYTGKAKYTAAKNLWELFENPLLAKTLLTEDHALVDLQSTSDDAIVRKKHIALFEYIMKHVQMRDMLKLWESVFKRLPNAVTMDKEHGYFYIGNLLWYIDGRLSETKRNELSDLIMEYLPRDDGNNIMKTIADSYRAEGVNKGIEIGKNKGIEIGKNKGIEIGNAKVLKIAKNLLSQNLDINSIASITGLSVGAVRRLKN